MFDKKKNAKRNRKELPRNNGGHLNLVLRPSTPGSLGEAKSRSASLSCDVGLLMASANRSRIESCSGGLELVLCPHYPIYRAYTHPRGVLTLVKEL